MIAARVAGVGPLRLMFATVLPNCLAPLIVQAALGVSDAILEAAALGFLGLGAQPPTPEWGAMLADAREFMTLRSMDRDASGPRHPDHRRLASTSWATGCATRSIRSCRASDEERWRCSEIRNLTVEFATRHGAFPRGRRRRLRRSTPDEVLAIVGESGSGKSVAMLAVMGLLPWTATRHRRSHELRRHRSAQHRRRRERRRIIGRDIAMIFQEPMSSLNPCFTVGFQIGEIAQDASRSGQGRAGVARSLELLKPGRHHRSRAAARGIPAPAVGRHVASA